ncbi:hypothetical protein ACWGM0_17890 [Sphingomonas bisphenolicum]
MLNLDAERIIQQPWWFTLQDAVIGETPEDSSPAVRVQFAPIGRVALRAAKRAAGSCYVGLDLSPDDNKPLPPEVIEQAGDALSDSLLRSGIIGWEGVGDAHGEPVPLTPDNLDLFLADPTRWEALDSAYVRPFMLRELEKNVSSLSRNGISAGATQEKAIANRSARRSDKAVAKRSRKKTAKPALISKTKPGPTPA